MHVFTTARSPCHIYQSWPRCRHFTLPSYFCHIHPNISSHLRIGLESCLFPAAFPTKTLYVFFLSPIHTTSPAHLMLDVSPEQYPVRTINLYPISYSLLLFPPSWVQTFSSIILFSNTLSLCSSLNMRHQIQNPYKNRQTEISLYYSLYIIQ